MRPNLWIAWSSLCRIIQDGSRDPRLQGRLVCACAVEMHSLALWPSVGPAVGSFAFKSNSSKHPGISLWKHLLLSGYGCKGQTVELCFPDSKTKKAIYNFLDRRLSVSWTCSSLCIGNSKTDLPPSAEVGSKLRSLSPDHFSFSWKSFVARIRSQLTEESGFFVLREFLVNHTAALAAAQQWSQKWAGVGLECLRQLA